MLRNKAFINNTNRYDDWFERNSTAYACELKAFEKLGIKGLSVEIGVGTGKFAEPLGITLGVEPTPQMFHKAKELGIDIIQGIAEELPLSSDTFDWVMMVTTICFVTDPEKAMAEMFRITKHGGRCAIGLVDKDTELGGMYLAKKDKSDFYKEATFYSAEEVIRCMTKAGYANIGAYQTLTGTSVKDIEEPLKGHGKGGFVVIYGEKPSPS
jgi:ubiquinone/menaquinone biosynthesis C-methylase UbiE